MNLNILNTEVQKFINTNLKTNLTKLILKGSPFSGVSIQEIANQIVSKNKAEKKLPTWYNTPNIYYPNKLNIEQTSSEITAKHKANLVSGKSLIDITGGFGVDAFYFSKVFDTVVHCEINEELSTIARHNLNQLHVKNIDFITNNGITFLKKGNTKFDWIFVDPSRRNNIKGKVFLLNDCEPNLRQNLDVLFNAAENILVKISPLLDIKSAINELNYVNKIQVISVNNEVKEVLALLKYKVNNSDIPIETFNYTKNEIQQFSFQNIQEYLPTFSAPKKYIFEPNAAILKSGGFKALSAILKIPKLNLNSHLYTSDILINFPGRCFIIKNVFIYNKKNVKYYLKFSQANITTRNFPYSVEKIRSITKLKDGGNIYLFFTTNLNNELIVLICNKT